MIITLLLRHKENNDQGEFMNTFFAGAICKFALTYQRGNAEEFLKMCSFLKLTPKRILSYIYH